MKHYRLTIVFALLALCSIVSSRMAAQTVMAEPPIDSEWYYDYKYGSTGDESLPQTYGYTKIKTIGKSERQGKNVVEYQATHVTKFGSATEPPFYIYYEGPKAYLQRKDGSLHLLYDLSATSGDELELCAFSKSAEEASPIKTKVLSRQEIEISGKSYVTQEYQPLSLLVYGTDTIRSYTVTQHIGMSRLEALGSVEHEIFVAMQGGGLRYYQGGGISHAPSGAAPRDAIVDESTAFTDHPLTKGRLWYIRHEIGGCGSNAQFRTDIYHLTGQVIEQEGKQYHVIERYFSLDGPDTPHKNFFYLRYDAEQGIEYFSGRSTDGKPGYGERPLYDYKKIAGWSFLKSQRKGGLPLSGTSLPFQNESGKDSKGRRVYKYTHSKYESSFSWIEGVGWDQGFWPYAIGLSGGGPDLLIYAEDQEGRTYGEKKFINTGIDNPASPDRDVAPYSIWHNGSTLYAQTSSLAGFSKQRITLYNAAGEILRSYDLDNNEQQVSIASSLESGVYFWQISGEMQKSWSGKLIVP
ncbi:Por secretion system C-terminal sorting domain [Porphyromonas crevioricanis]|uniref:Por secretion system C-terminal sorting domain n=5 Tax=Porphyromonas crevioricanis TaxID=393921 RepID=A0A2X4PM64_9PORP|nr:T9SS type A sorting domain-containing protein [Porphyromonas crevioricanis]SQH72913.1 Por secretion system C-terminal sorting domain [Porphyromonas crevioricanis]